MKNTILSLMKRFTTTTKNAINRIMSVFASVRELNFIKSICSTKNYHEIFSQHTVMAAKIVATYLDHRVSYRSFGVCLKLGTKGNNYHRLDLTFTSDLINWTNEEDSEGLTSLRVEYLLQFFSSELSRQLLRPSHLHEAGMH